MIIFLATIFILFDLLISISVLDMLAAGKFKTKLEFWLSFIPVINWFYFCFVGIRASYLFLKKESKKCYDDYKKIK